MKDFSKESVKAIIEADMQEYGIEDLYTIGYSGQLLEIQDGFEFFAECEDKEFCRKLSADLSDIDEDIWTCVTRLTERSKERAASMLRPVYLKGEYVGDHAN